VPFAVYAEIDDLDAMTRIVDELHHFSVPNHGKLWKSLMRAHLGDYEELESRLNSTSKDTR
jgi:hypothetical protein